MANKFIRLPDVMAKTGKSRSAVYRDNTFPKHVKIGLRASAWLEQEVDDWIASRIASSRDIPQKAA